jgi:hypothetical protein
MSLVYLVVVLKDGRRGWYVASDTRLDEFKRPIQSPLFDDEKAKQVTLDFALDARERWRDYCRQQLGADLRIAQEKYGTFIEEDRPSPSTGQDDSRVRRFVPFTNGLGLIVTPGNTPTGPAWFVRASDIPFFVSNGREAAVESVFGDTPESAAQRAVDVWGQQILFENPEAVAERERQQKQAEQQKLNSRFAGVRPGDIPR